MSSTSPDSSKKLEEQIIKAIAPLAEGWAKWAQDELDGTSHLSEELEYITKVIVKSRESIEALIALAVQAARIDELEQLKFKHSRTYTQSVTDNAGNVYISDSHSYISKYETQERIATLTNNKKGSSEHENAEQDTL